MHSRFPGRRSSWHLAAVVALLALGAGPATAQQAFRVTHNRPSTDATHFLVSGTVHNDAPREALDVSVTAEALDGSRKVVASGIVYVAGSIPARGSAGFVAKIPKVPGASSFRVAVTAFRYGFAAEAP